VWGDPGVSKVTKMHLKSLATSFLILFLQTQVHSQDIATALMRSTFKIQGQGAGKPVSGTVFILGQPIGTNGYGYVLVTAKHVLDDIKGASGTLILRKRSGEAFERFNHEIPLRTNGVGRWVTHPEADVAVMRVGLPPDIDLQLISTDLFATDQILTEYEIGPGQELLVLGFPLGLEANAAGFPILRSGRIASYPLVPTSKSKTFLMDFQVFPGNSGGPVLLVARNPTIKGATHIMTVQSLIGVVSQEMAVTERVESLTEESLKRHKLALGVIVHASFVKETLAMLPPIKK
jgi:S1-C subfamily serine protease